MPLAGRSGGLTFWSFNRNSVAEPKTRALSLKLTIDAVCGPLAPSGFSLSALRASRKRAASSSRCRFRSVSSTTYSCSIRSASDGFSSGGWSARRTCTLSSSTPTPSAQPPQLTATHPCLPQPAIALLDRQAVSFPSPPDRNTKHLAKTGSTDQSRPCQNPRDRTGPLLNRRSGRTNPSHKPTRPPCRTLAHQWMPMLLKPRPPSLCEPTKPFRTTTRPQRHA